MQNDSIQVVSLRTVEPNKEDGDLDQIHQTLIKCPNDSIDAKNTKLSNHLNQENANLLENNKVECEQESIENVGMDQIAIKNKQTTNAHISSNE